MIESHMVQPPFHHRDLVSTHPPRVTACSNSVMFLDAHIANLSLMSTSASCFTNLSCFCHVSTFVSPSAAILPVSIHWIRMSPVWTRSRSQCWLMSTCRSFVIRMGVYAVRSRIVYQLSFLMISLCSGSNRSFLNKLFHQIACFPACSMASSSASVIEVVTVDCLQDTQSIGPP